MSTRSPRPRYGDQVTRLPDRLDRIERRQLVHTMLLAALLGADGLPYVGTLAGAGGKLLALLAGWL